jgi:hypothetical protein
MPVLLDGHQDQPFLNYYDESAITDAGTYNGKVYQINLGRVSTAAYITTKICSLPTTSLFPPLGANWLRHVKRSKLWISPA